MTIARVLDKKRKTLTGENAGRYHIKIRLTYTIDKRTIQKYFLTGVFANESEFAKILGNPGKDKDLQAKQSQLNAIYEKGKTLLVENPFIDALTFGDRLTEKGGSKDPLGMMLEYAEQLRTTGNIGTAEYYECAHASFFEYSRGSLSFARVTDKWLMSWEQWMIERGRSITTVGMYAIAMRRVFNIARTPKKRIIPAELYPFGEGGYIIPTAKGRKLALHEDQKDKLLNYATLDIAQRKAVDFWKLSYFCFGINMADIAFLRWSNIVDDVIIFTRQKTRNTERNRKETIVAIRPEVREIIERWGNKDKSANNFVFPILREGLTASQIDDRIHKFTKAVNEGLEAACEKLKLKKITTYSARHTSATIAKKNGASVEFIQERLGHADKRTTQAYLDSFDIDTIKKHANML